LLFFSPLGHDFLVHLDGQPDEEGLLQQNDEEDERPEYPNHRRRISRQKIQMSQT
jgi:hypothetical protein